MRTFFQELKRRRVYRVALAYVIAASATVQVVGTILPAFHAPDWIFQLFVFLLALGFPVALVLGWIFDISIKGLHKTKVATPAQSTDYRRITVLGSVGLVLAAIALSGYWLWHPWKSKVEAAAASNLPLAGTANAPPIPEKSIAVIPFTNLSDDKKNAYFADGVQDEILTDLAKVSDLKVISRTSVMQYRAGAERNLREIGKSLGVAYILEGAVERDGQRVRVSAQLIDARTDTHVWADSYERNLSDLFALQSDLAETIVRQLKTKISPAEKAAIEQPPTYDLVAHDLYTQANVLLAASAFNVQGTDNLFRAAELLQQAVARDPSFFLAYCRLASAYDQIYLTGADHTPRRLALADAAVRSAQRLRPNSGETHLALAEHLYCGYLDYDRAHQELAIAQQTLPNEPMVFALTGYIDRRQGNWNNSQQNLVRALQLDPQNVYTLQQLAQSYQYLRRFADASEILNRALAIKPDEIELRVARAAVELYWRANPRPLHEVIESLVSENAKNAAGLADDWLLVALCERDSVAAHRAVAAMTPLGYNNAGMVFPRSWCRALVAQMDGDAQTARAAFNKARDDVGQTVLEQPNYGESLSVLGMIDAALGRKAEAVSEGRRAIELLPLDKDSIDGALALEYLAVIYAWTGDTDAAIAQLKGATAVPGYLSYGELHLHVIWDALRADPRFADIANALAPTNKTSTASR